MALKCPNCGLYSPDTAAQCDCGYSFASGQKQVSKMVLSQGGNTRQGDQDQVTIVDIRMPFGSMVTFMVKWAIASVPAIMILFTLGWFFTVVVGAAFIGVLAGIAKAFGTR